MNHPVAPLHGNTIDHLCADPVIRTLAERVDASRPWPRDAFVRAANDAYRIAVRPPDRPAGLYLAAAADAIRVLCPALELHESTDPRAVRPFRKATT